MLHIEATKQPDRFLVIASVLCEAIYRMQVIDCFGSTWNVDPRNDAPPEMEKRLCSPAYASCSLFLFFSEAAITFSACSRGTSS